MKVGQTVYVKTWNRLVETKIEKIGRKYIYVEAFKRQKFDKETLREVDAVGTANVLYLSKEDWENEKLHRELCLKFRQFPWYKLSLEKLKEVNDLISENN